MLCDWLKHMLHRFTNQSAVKSKQNATSTLRQLAPVTCVSSDDWLILAQEELHLRWPHHLPLPYANINPYFSLGAKCWLWGGVGGQFPRGVWSRTIDSHVMASEPLRILLMNWLFENRMSRYHEYNEKMKRYWPRLTKGGILDLVWNSAWVIKDIT